MKVELRPNLKTILFYRPVDRNPGSSYLDACQANMEVGQNESFSYL